MTRKQRYKKCLSKVKAKQRKSRITKIINPEAVCTGATGHKLIPHELAKRRYK